MAIDNQTVVIDIIARLKDEVTGNIDSINKQVQVLSSEFDKLNSLATGDVSDITKKIKELDEAINSIKTSSASKKINDLGKSTKNSKQNFDPFVESMKKTKKQVEELTKDKWTIRLEAIDKSSDTISRLSNNIGGIADKTFRFTLRMTDLATKPLQGIYKMATNPVVAFGSVAGVSLGLKDTIDTYRDFEQTMANVKAITRSTPAEFRELNQTAKELGRTTAFSASEVAQGMTYLGMAGWDKDSIKRSMPGLLDLSLAGQTDLATTSDILSDVMTAFDIDPKRMYNREEKIANTDHVADVFAATITGSNTDIAMLGDTMKYAAPIAHEFQMSLEETAAISGMMANAGIKSSQAGTTLRSALARLSKKPKEAEEELSLRDIRLSDKVTGDLRPIADIVADLGGALKGLPKEEKLASAGKIFGTDALSGWLAVLNQGEEELRGFTKALEDADGRARDIAMIQGDTLQGSFKRLQNAIEGTKVGLGEKLTPSLRGFTDSITSQIPVIDKSLNRAADLTLNKINSIKSSFRDLTTGVRWGYAESLSEKIGLSWDKIIAEPFTDWWNGSGQRFISDAANKIGGGLGKFYKSGIDLMLGNGINGADSLVGIGKSFADGFLKGFDIENTSKKIMSGIKDSFKGSYFNLGAYKEDKSLVNTAISGFMAYKSFSAAAPIGKGIYNGGKLIKDIVDLTRTSPAAEKSLMGTRLTGFEAGMSSGAIPVASILAATGGAISAFRDFTDAYKSGSKKERIDNLAQGITKSSMLGGGAILGGIFGGPAGAIVGAGLGGLGSLAFGDGLGSFFGDVADGTKRVDRMIDSLRKAEDRASEIRLKNMDVDNTIRKFQELDRIIRDGKAPIDERNEAERVQKDLVGALADKYPELVSLYELENLKLSDNLDNMKNIVEMEKANTMAEIQSTALELSLKIPDLEATMSDEQVNIDRLAKEKAERDPYILSYVKVKNELTSISNEREHLDITRDKYTPEQLQEEIDKLWERQIKAVQEINKVREEQGLELYGVETAGDGKEYFNTRRILEDSETYISDHSKISKELDKAKERYDEAKKQYEHIFGLQKTAIEYNHNLDGSIEDNVKNWDKLSLAEQKSVKGAIKDVEDLIKTMDRLPSDHYINIRIADGKILQYEDKEKEKKAHYEEVTQPHYPAQKKPTEFAIGGILTEPHLGLVAEAGPEAIIPLSGGNRERGKYLWEKAGLMLGTIPQHADGGIFGDTIYKKPPKIYNTPITFEDLQSDNNTSNLKAPISINLGGINITIEGSTNLNDNKSIVKSIREEMPTIANDLCEQISTMLQKVFDNMTMEV